MKAVVQRVAKAGVSVNGNVVGEIEQGLLVFLGIEQSDSEEDAALLARKVANLRIFCDEEDKMNLSLLDISAAALVISNFTLCADTKKGNRPSFINAMEPHTADKLYRFFCEELKNNGVIKIETGVFGADMKVNLINDGPITLVLDTQIWRKNK